MIYKSCENPSKHDMTGQEHKSPLRGWLQSPPWTNPPISDPWHVPGMILQKSSYITYHQSIIPHLCWTFNLLILKLVKKERIQENCYLFSLPPVQGIPSLPHLIWHVPLDTTFLHGLLCVAVCVCLLRGNVGQFVNGQCRETLLFQVDASLATLEPDSSLWRLPTLIYDLDPWTEILLVTSLTHTDRHTHLSLTSCEKSLYNCSCSVSVLLGRVWPGCVVVLCHSAKNCLSVWPCNKELPGRIKNAKLMETLWHGRLTMGNMMADLWKWEVRVW